MAIDTWIELGTCMHCGARIEGRPARSISSMTIAGLEPMEYRHIGSETTECRQTIVNRCVPYSPWNKREEWEKAKDNPAHAAQMRDGDAPALQAGGKDTRNGNDFQAD